MDVCLRAVSELAIIAIAKPLLGNEGDVQRWKASWVAGFATYFIVCHSIKICVGMKRDQVALRNKTEVCAFILKYILQFLVPLSHSSLAYAYLTGIETKNHHMEDDWKMVALGIRVLTLVVGSLLALMGACKICYSAANEQYQITAIQTNVENVSGLGQWDVENQSFAPEEIQMDVDDDSYPDTFLSHSDVETQLLADANVSEEPQMYEENQSFSMEEIPLDVDDHSYPDACLWDSLEGVENHSQSNANVLEETQRNMENQSFAQEDTRFDVEDHSYPDACLSDWLECAVENPSLADANVSEEVQRDGEDQYIASETVSEKVQRDVESRPYFMDLKEWPECLPSTSESTPDVMEFVNLWDWDRNGFTDTNDLKLLLWDVDKQFYADATVIEEEQRYGEQFISRCKCNGTNGGGSITWRCKCIANADVLEQLS